MFNGDTQVQPWETNALRQCPLLAQHILAIQGTSTSIPLLDSHNSLINLAVSGLIAGSLSEPSCACGPGVDLSGFVVGLKLSLAVYRLGW